MFTGIVETMGRVVGLKKDINAHFQIESIIGTDLKVDQSVSHNGVCLTVVKVTGKIHHTVAIYETLLKSNMGSLRIGDRVNLERCMLSNGRFDGHIVQGHVDQTGVVTSIRDQQGSWLIDISYDPAGGNVTVEKGSIAVNGVSLTCFNSQPGAFTIAIIPFTYEQTTFNDLKPGDTVNLEFDIIGKYVKRLMNQS